MEKELKAQWVDALRSGNYKQGTKSLLKNNKYCCLGVLCEELGLSKVGPDPKNFSEETGFCYNDGKAFGKLPVGLGEKIGIDEYTERKLIGMNDHKSLSFDEIANWIEENL